MEDDDDIPIRRRETPLTDYSVAELKQEIRRREEPKPPRRDRFKPCDECKHFIPWTKNFSPPDDYNPCGKGHKMRFRMPVEPYDHWELWGFYREGCRDRRKAPPPPPLDPCSSAFIRGSPPLP